MSIKIRYCSDLDEEHAEISLPIPKVLIIVRGGVAHYVWASVPADVTVFDYDNLRAEGKTERQCDAAFKKATKGLQTVY